MKVIYFFVITFIAFSFASCQEDVIEEESGQIKIVLSGSNLKSGSPDVQSVNHEVYSGDTILVHNLKDVHLIFSALSGMDMPIEGQWTIFLSDSDQENDSLIFLGIAGSSEGKSMAFKLEHPGLYSVHFESPQGMVSFAIKHYALPGNLGDNFQNNSVFRLERNRFQKEGENDVKPGYTLYIKNVYRYEETGDYKNKYALVASTDDVFDNNGKINPINAQNFALKKCKYSPDYFTFSFLEEDINPVNNIYDVTFYAGDYGSYWYVLPMIYESDWKKNNSYSIVFTNF